MAHAVPGGRGRVRGLVALLDSFTAPRLGWSALVTVLLVFLPAPLFPRLQRLVTGAIYGDRGDPARVVSRLGEQLATPVRTCREWYAVRTAFRLPLSRDRASWRGLASGVSGESIHP